MAAKYPKPVVVGNTTYELVAADDCGTTFDAIVKTVSRGEGKAPKVKRLVFNREHREAIAGLFK